MYTFKIICSGGLRVLVALVEDPDLVPSIHTVAHNPQSPVLWGLMVPGMHMVVQRHTQVSQIKYFILYKRNLPTQRHRFSLLRQSVQR